MSGHQQPPNFSDKIPIEAQALLMQPEAVNMLRQLQGFDLISLFYFQMPFMFLPKDINTIEKNGQKIVSLAGLSLLLGVAANTQIKRINMNFLKWSWYKRLPIRLGIMGIPFLAFYPTLNQKSDQLLNIVNSVTDRKNKLLVTKDLYEYFEIQQEKQNSKTKNKKK